MHPNDAYSFIDASNFRICASEGSTELWQDVVTANTTSSWHIDYATNPTTSNYIGWFPQEVTSNIITWGGGYNDWMGWSNKDYSITLRGSILNSEPKDEIPDPEYSFEEMMEIEEA